MDLTPLLNSYPGVHIVQAFFHALVAAILADRAIAAWDIQSPMVRQKLHLLAVFAPLVSYPLYQWIDPERGSIQFRLAALFDSNRWLSLELWDVLPVVWLFIAVLVATTALFLVQELIPILRHDAGPQEDEPPVTPAAPDSAVVGMVRELPGESPDVFVVEDEDPSIHSVTNHPPGIYVTTGLLESLEPDELRVAIAHEVAHIRRSRRSIMILAYLVRVLLFFSPGTLVAFRKAADEEEKICDDWAVRVTGRPDALASVLEKLRHSEAYDVDEHDPGEALRAVERMSYDLMVRERIRRLAARETVAAGAGEWLKFAVTAAAMAALGFYVV